MSSSSKRRKKEKEKDDFFLKPDYAKRPLYLIGKHTVFLEAFTTFSSQAVDFLTAVAEPVARPKYFQEWQLSRTSLLHAVAIGLDATSIIKVLDRLSKASPSDEMKAFINTCCNTDQARLVLQQGKYHVESKSTNVLESLLQNPVIASARIRAASPSSSRTWWRWCSS